ncbi:MAG: hypothetical protein B6241_07735 [Spirochaetaceae bacterium 4572_59]|nr:MAG: hypothetical protein B6241_07735 [Spirochaetaceae bacterium 4572_59]
MKTNYHTHCSHCDGIADPETVVKTAIEKNFDILGFSSHSPLEGEDWTLSPEGVEDYVSEINVLKEKYQDQIQILVGMEMDFIPTEAVWTHNRWKNLDLDYMIGSVHMVPIVDEYKHLSIDGSIEELKELIDLYFKGDVRKMVEAYYDTIALMASRETMDFIGHLDVIKKRNRVMGFLNEQDSWYMHKVCEVLNVIAENNQRIEINTGGISRGATDALYPSQSILKECCKRNIPIVINSDSHNPKYLDGEFSLAREAALEAGYREQWILDRREWRPLPLK